MFYQNDFTELPGVVSEGCLFMSLLNIIESEFDTELTRDQIKAIYNTCNDKGYLGKDSGKSLDGAFVWDHIGVLNTASNEIGTGVRWSYAARIYTYREEQRGFNSFVNDSDYGSDDVYMIFQVKTTAVPGHFKRFNYDPWKPGSKETCLKSVRYYKRIK